MGRIFITGLLGILISLSAAAQTCTVTSGAVPALHAEGLAEAAGSIVVTCTGGVTGATITPNLFLTTNANITNRLDVNGNPTNISVTVNTGAGAVPAAGLSLQLLGARTLVLNGLQYVVPAGPGTAVITIGGLFVAPASTSPVSSLVTAQVSGAGVLIAGTPAQATIGFANTSLLDSVDNNGIPCVISPPPATLNFPNLISAGTATSTLRVTEAFGSAFSPKAGTADTGVRILVGLSGYGNTTQVYVPDYIVGNTGTTPTSSGDYNTTTIAAGTYTPGANQLLFIRVNGADANGAGGSLASGVPTAATTFSSVTQIQLTNGSGYAVYEVADGNPNIKEFAQIPVFVTTTQSFCQPTVPSLSATLAPVSTVTVATQTDPIPRFLATTPGLDCAQIGDCGAPYFPVLVVNPTSVTLNGTAFGAQQKGNFVVGNGGGGALPFAQTITYQSGSNWLTASTARAGNNTQINLIADPGALAQGAYQATVTINAGVWGSVNVPVTFSVGPQGPKLAVTPATIALSAPSLGTAQQSSFAVSNTGAGTLNFTTAVAYQSGTNWLTLSPASGTNNTTINLTASPAALTPGIYQATVTVNGGAAGSTTVNVTFTVGTPAATIQSVVNSANLQSGPITAGSYATIFGVSLAGTNVQVTFNSVAATVIYDGATQINVLVPAALGSATQAAVVATINGQISNTFTVSLTQNAPAVFNPGILNQDNSVNLTNQPAARGTYVQIFLTGLATPVTGPVTVTIGSATGLVPVYAGASSISGLEQVNVLVPVGLTFAGNSAPLSICIAGSCSAPVNLYVK